MEVIHNHIYIISDTNIVHYCPLCSKFIKKTGKRMIRPKLEIHFYTLDLSLNIADQSFKSVCPYSKHNPIGFDLTNATFVEKRMRKTVRMRDWVLKDLYQKEANNEIKRFCVKRTPVPSGVSLWGGSMLSPLPSPSSSV